MRFFIAMALMVTWLFGFGFDHWYSGMSMQKSITQAKSKNIALVTREYEERLPRLKGFDAKFIKELDFNRMLIYRGLYLGEMSTVYLHYTKQSQRLYKLSIRWDHPSTFVKQSKKKIAMTLIEEFNAHYGKYRKVIDTRDSLHRYKQWNIDANNSVMLRSAFYHLSIIYRDHTMRSLHQKELEKHKQKNKIHFSVRDENATDKNST